MREPRGNYGDNRPVFWWALWTLVGVFFLQQITAVWFGSNALGRFLQLSESGLRHFWLWTVVTYGLLHGSIMHLLFNLLAAFLIGRGLVQLYGHKCALQTLIAGTLTGGIVTGILYLVFSATNMATVGVSGGVTALIVLFCTMNPGQHIHLFILIFPIRLRTETVLLIVLVPSALFFLLEELPILAGKAVGQSGGVSHSTHLGGALGGWLFAKYLRNPAAFIAKLPRFLRERPGAESPRSPAVRKPRFRLNVRKRPSDKSEIDRILDKINEHGFGSLTAEERERLDRARDRL